MKIELSGISKRFNYDWVFHQIHYLFQADQVYAITGPNGSGKSTLLRMIAGQLSPSEGSITYTESFPVKRESVYRHVAVSAPYIDLPEELTLQELVRFQGSMKPYRDALQLEEVIALTGLANVRNKTLRFYSSGMKQRVRNALAILSDASILILDEPTSNLDEAGCAWYTELLDNHRSNRIVLIGSNQPREYTLSSAGLDMSSYRKVISS